MKIAKLYMDPQDKQKFEIQGKSSVKYHLKANHQVEAKRWYWALNNAIQWSKDEAREEERQHTRENEAMKQAKMEQLDKRPAKEGDSLSITSSRLATKNLMPCMFSVVCLQITCLTFTATSLGVPLTSGEGSRYGASTADDGDPSNYEPSVAGNELGKMVSNVGTATVEGDVDDDEEYGDDASSHELQQGNKDAFNITAQSAKLQLDLLAQVSTALQAERSKNPTMQISDPVAVQVLSSYEAAVGNLKGLVGDLLRISRDRDAYWQYRLDREANVRRMWEESMAQVAREQEELETRIGQSELKRRKTKRALREALEGYEMNESRPVSREGARDSDEFEAAEDHRQAGPADDGMLQTKPSFSSAIMRRKSTYADLAAEISDTDDDEDEEFFDAVGAGEVEVVEMPIGSPGLKETEMPASTEELFEDKMAQIMTAFKGYEDPPRNKLAMDDDNRPKISLWVSLDLLADCKISNRIVRES